MKNSFVGRTIGLSSLLSILVVFPLTAAAQRDSTRPPEVLIRAKELNEAERLRDLRSVPKVPPVSDKEMKKIRASLMKQLGDDFRNLQIVDNEMMSETVVSKQLNCERLAMQLAQIKTRAANLKLRLALPDPPASPAAPSPKKDLPQPVTDQLVRTQLNSLDQSIQDFVKNPIFRDPNVLDVKLSAQASQNLRSILELSEEIKKNTNKLTRVQKAQP